MKLDTVLAKRENKVVYKDGALAAKVFDECYPKSDILNEALNQARVEEQDSIFRKLKRLQRLTENGQSSPPSSRAKLLRSLWQSIPKKRTNT